MTEEPTTGASGPHEPRTTPPPAEPPKRGKRPAKRRKPRATQNNHDEHLTPEEVQYRLARMQSRSGASFSLTVLVIILGGSIAFLYACGGIGFMMGIKGAQAFVSSVMEVTRTGELLILVVAAVAARAPIRSKPKQELDSQAPDPKPSEVDALRAELRRAKKRVASSASSPPSP